MRVATIGIGLLLFTTAAYAQAPPCAPHPYAYDPYNPSDLAIMRQYGGTMLAQAPLSTLLKLDPYVPSQGELLRQVGNGIPLWLAYPWPAYALPSPPPASDCMPAPKASAEASHEGARAITTFADALLALERVPSTTGRTKAPTARMSTERNAGVSIQFDGRTWTSAGPAVPYNEASFVQVGESDRFPVFRRAASNDDRIFVPTTNGMVAPFQPGR
jgi:hypothetical protein